MTEQPRPNASSNEHSYLLSVEEAADRCAAAGHTRTIRAIQKYCRRGIAEGRNDVRRTVSNHTGVHRPPIVMIMARSQPNVREQPRPDAADDHYVEQLEKRLNEKDRAIGFLRFGDRRQERPPVVEVLPTSIDYLRSRRCRDIVR